MSARPGPIELDFKQSQHIRSATRASHAGAMPHTHDIVFTGSGSEYFRIWIVNLLLTVLTLSLYYPWAKARRLRYFSTNTKIGGHALDFHGQPRVMLRGHLLVLALLGVYVLSEKVSPIVQGLALIVIGLMWPALWRASMQFRLANTSWRGLRFRFTGSLGGAYLALLLPLAVIFAAVALGAVLVPLSGAQAAAGLAGGLTVIAAYGLIPYYWLRIKRYQHNHYAYAQLESRLDVSAGRAYLAFIKFIAIGLLSGLVVILPLVGILFYAFGLSSVRPGSESFRLVLMQLSTFAPLIFLVLLLAQAVPRAYLTAKLQNVLWSGTGSSALRFDSRLRFGALAWLLVKNWVLVIVTLGLYWPWAAIAVARLRMEAVELHTRDAIDSLSMTERPRTGDAAGDAAGDAFGIDFGL